MSTESSNPADIIATALSRLRGRRGGAPHAHQHPRGEHGPGGRGAGRMGWEAGRNGALAVVRMLDALAAAPEPLSVSGLAEAVGVDQPRASRLVQQGVDRGWVRREADPDDARRTRIALTDDGARMIRGMRGERRERLDQALTAFTDDERDELARLLTKLAKNWRG
ncbi:MarR family winged helix-turn-helix transcriptional regulator [Microbacterium esteraromaticum]|nr:MarR family winged helix-turn-helix transcriptional regulator [Microbacterium esteraromaticum]